jgi:hypothetical protein
MNNAIQIKNEEIIKDYSKKTKNELLKFCEENNIKLCDKKKKEDILHLIMTNINNVQQNTDIIPILSYNNIDYIAHINKIIIIQKNIRGFLHRIKQLPLILYKIKNHLKKAMFDFSSQTNDGRINSCLDEANIINILIKKYGDIIKTVDKRHWCDILVFDKIYGWIPVNIKTTRTTKGDNTGNLAMCVYSYTNENLDLNKLYNNGKMAEILFRKLKNKEYNRKHKKDYYFIVLNKTNQSDVIVNSVRGLSILKPNINNLPFQVKWNNNKEYKYDIIDNKIKMFINCLKKPKPSWKETFMLNIRTVNI